MRKLSVIMLYVKECKRVVCERVAREKVARER